MKKETAELTKKQIESLNKQKEEILLRKTKVVDAICAIMAVKLETEAEPMLKRLDSEKEDLGKAIEKICTAIKSLQDLCDHKNEKCISAFEYEGHDSHNDYYKCSICGCDR